LLALIVYVALFRLMKRRKEPLPPTLADVVAQKALPGLGGQLAPAQLAADGGGIPLAALPGAAAAGMGLAEAGAGTHAATAAAAAAGGAVPHGEAGAAAAAAAAPSLQLPAAPEPDAEAVEKVRLLASDMASKEPEAAARVLRSWLNEGAANKETNA
jgi:hypothetical protein